MAEKPIRPATEGHTPGPWGVGWGGSQANKNDRHYVILRPYACTIDTENRVASISGGSDNAEADAHLIASAPTMKARIEAQAATIRERDEEIAKLQGIIMGTSTEARVTLGVNLRRYWSVDDQVVLGRMLFDEDVPALRAQNAAQAEEIERLRKVRTGSAVERLHNLCDGFEESDAERERESAELRARCETLEGRILRWDEQNRNDELMDEARAIRARREAGR